MAAPWTEADKGNYPACQNAWAWITDPGTDASSGRLAPQALSSRLDLLTLTDGQAGGVRVWRSVGTRGEEFSLYEGRGVWSGRGEKSLVWMRGEEFGQDEGRRD